MRKHFFFTQLFFTIPVFIFCQSVPEVSYRFSSHYGYSVGSKAGQKKIMLATGVTNTIEKNLKATLYFTFGVDVTALKYNYYTATNNSVFSNNYLLLVPVTLKKYYFISKRSSLFMDFGIAASYYFYCKKEIENIGSSTQRNLGLSIGGLGRIGFKTAVTPKVSFDVGLNSFSDFLYFYKDDANKITVKTNSLMFSFCKELK